MRHLSDDDLVLVFYDEAGAEEREHVVECPRCRAELDGLREALAELTETPIPEPDDDYGSRVWTGLQTRLARPSWRWATPAWIGAAAAIVLAATFLAGRLSVRPPPPETTRNEEVRERILLLALGDHLRESQVLLLEIANRPQGTENLPIRERAEDLVQESRLYRQTARRVGDVVTADVLDELERFLLDVAHGPTSTEALEGLSIRIADRDLIFKLRVLEANVSEKTIRRF
ncbi:MAG TPA: hypothetical protein VEK15_27085 [Vicinamibacteria bacterium]|nr:hypothetical protein [Vicinamibacteria bacterium]